MNFTVFSTLPPADPVSLPLMSSPSLTLLIVAIYLSFVLKLGRDFMKNRNPYNVRNAMLIYNLIQVIFNSILCGYGVKFLINANNFRCMNTLALDHPLKNTERLLMYIYFLNKIMDFLDTAFFVLRKSYKQITVLHIYHHVLMVTATPFIYKFYGAGGQFFLMGILNTLVHVFMYSYYFVTALYPQLKGNLWWKKYITEMQLIQFIILLFQVLFVWIFNPSCTVPLGVQIIQLTGSTSMIVMFGNFYYHTYIKDKRLKAN